MSEQSPWEQLIGSIKRQKSPSASLDSAPCLLSCREILAFYGWRGDTVMPSDDRNRKFRIKGLRSDRCQSSSCPR